MNFAMSHPFLLGGWVGGQIQYEILYKCYRPIRQNDTESMHD